VEKISAKIQQRCQLISSSQDQIIKCIKDVELDTTDHHLYFSKIGERLNFVSEIIIRRGLCSIYVEDNMAILKPLADKIKSELFKGE
ncbi:MAG: hypothetical protein ACRCTI_03605, partial [Beijerinckiaceae bacterium]